MANKNLSPQMLDVLEDVAAGRGTHGSARGMSQHGGRHGTVLALRRRGLLEGVELTAAGRAELEKRKDKNP